MRRMVLVLLCTLLCLAMVASMSSCKPGEQTKVLQAAHDETLIESSMGELSDGSGPVFLVGRTGQPAGSIRRGLITFDIASVIPAGSKITSVKLTLNMKLGAGEKRQGEGGSSQSRITLHRVLTGWGEGPSRSEGGRGAQAMEGDATWIHTFYPNSLWSSPGGDYAPNESSAQEVADTGPYVWNSTPAMVADVQSWLDSPAKNFGWILLGDETRGATAKVFNSRQSPDEATRPQLTITFVPNK